MGRRRPASLRRWLSLAVGLLAATTLATAVVASIERGSVNDAQNRIRDHLRPAFSAEQSLTTAYINQESGQRGYLLTGDASFLEPYHSGQLAASITQAALTTYVRSDAPSRALLDKAITAGTRWIQQAAAPEIALRQRGPIPTATMIPLARSGKALFDDLRAQLAALSARTQGLIGDQLQRVTHVESTARTVIDVALGVSIVIALLAVGVLEWLLARPLRRLLTQLRTVTAGDYRQPIEARGPAEFVTVGEAAEHMRANIVRRTAEMATTQQQLTVRDERDRMAADLHDLIIQRVFALGISLNSMASRSPQFAAELGPLVDETDLIIRELRNVIFAIGREQGGESLHAAILDQARDSERLLGFRPHVDIAGPVDTAPPPPDLAQELLAVLRELLSNVGRHAHARQAWVTVRIDGGQLLLLVRDDGVGTDGTNPGTGTRTIRERAERLHGTVTVSSQAGAGTTVQWMVPLQAAPADQADSSG